MITPHDSAHAAIEHYGEALDVWYGVGTHAGHDRLMLDGCLLCSCGACVKGSTFQ